jgi:hypothetical protein
MSSIYHYYLLILCLLELLVTSKCGYQNFRHCYLCNNKQITNNIQAKDEYCENVNYRTTRTRLKHVNWPYCYQLLTVVNNKPLLERGIAKLDKWTTTICDGKEKEKGFIYCFTCNSDLCNNGPMWTPGERFDGLYDQDELNKGTTTVWCFNLVMLLTTSLLVINL